MVRMAANILSGRVSVAAVAVAILMTGTAQAQAPAAPDAPAPAEPAAAPVAGAASPEEIVVTGSRLAASGFTAPTPVTVVGEQEIARQAAPNVSEVLNQVPAFRAQSTPATTAIFVSNIGASNADLRGLGANRTLVLIDGRRVVASTVQGGSFTPANTVDLNLVPTALIQRAEVVTGGASAAYGSDAVAGVVNLILNKDLTGIRGNVQYGENKYGDGEEYLLSLAGGTRFADGRGRFVAAIEYVDNLGTGDCYSRPWCAQSHNTISNPARLNGQPATLILPNARTATATRAGIINSGALRGTEFGPNGTTFRHDYGTYLATGPAFANGGIFQSGGGDPQLAFYENFAIAAPVERVNSYAHADFEVSDGFKLFAEGSYGRVDGSILGAQRRDLGNITIRGENAFLQSRYPLIAAAVGQTGTFNFGKIYNDLGATRGEVTRETYRGVAGFESKLSSRFTLDGYYQYGRTDYSQRGYNTTITPRLNFALDAVRNSAGQVVCAATIPGGPRFNAAAAGCVPYDPFGEGSFSPAAAAYVTGTSMQDTRLTQQVAALTLRGDLLDLWAGPLSIATGGEYRRDKANGTTDPISAANQFYTSPGASIDGRITVKEVFLEAGLPLARDVPFARTLELNGAVRYTDYSTTGGATTWKIGAVWEPVSWLRFRGTRSRDIRAPNIFELFGPRQSSFQTIIDPLNGSAQSLPQVFLVGNANLDAEKADTYTGGVVFQPGSVLGGRLRFSADWFDISLDGAISTLGAQVIVNRCATNSLPDCGTLVNRTGGAANGSILSINNANLNLNRLITRGIDFEGSYSLPLERIAPTLPGSVTWRVLATYVKDLITVDSSRVAIDRAGQNGSGVSQPSGLPSWTVSSYLTYDSGRFSAQAQFRWISGGRYDRTRIGPDEDGYSPAAANSINDNKVKAWYYTNINAQYALLNDGNRKVEIYGAINNLFDRDPPVDIPSSFGPTNNVLYDVLGRTYRVGARFSF
jgi:iron complex outermembrane receptor protein